MNDVLEVRLIREEKWLTPRRATINEVTHEDGRIRYHVDAIDKGRDKPFVHQEFAELEAAENFLEHKLMKHSVKEVRT